MATVVMMKHPQSGIVKKGFYGFSWTTLFFGGFPALFRGDIAVGLIVFVANFFTAGIAGLIWAFMYNKSYTHKLLEQGYIFADSEAANDLARAKLGVANAPASTSAPQAEPAVYQPSIESQPIEPERR